MRRNQYAFAEFSAEEMNIPKDIILLNQNGDVVPLKMENY